MLARLKISRQEDGVSILEIILYVIFAAGLVLAAWFLLSKIWDNIDNRQAQIALSENGNVIHTLFQDNQHVLPPEDEIVAFLNQESGNNFRAYNNGAGASTSSNDLSVTRDNDEQVSLCAKSRSDLVYCMRSNYQRLLIAGQREPESASPLAALNPLQMLFPEQAHAADTMDSNSGISRCVGLDEQDTRDCLADSTTKVAAVGTANPGWEHNGGEQETAAEEEENQNPSGNPFTIGDKNLVGISSLRVSGNSKITGGVGSNGRVEIIDSSMICGDLYYGEGTPPPVGHLANPNSNGHGGGICSGTNIGPGHVDYPPVTVPEDIADNSNSRLANADPVPDWVWQRGNVSWNSNRRELTVNYAELSLLGDKPYFLCRLSIQGGATLRVSDATRIFFDTPENCNNTTQPLNIGNGGRIDSSAGLPGLFVVGSDNIATNIALTGGSNVLSLVLYAPRTAINISNGSRFDGAIIGKSIDITGGSNLSFNFDGSDYLLPN